jgi:uncharacterized membrane protein HdeD (DUF308 family)
MIEQTLLTNWWGLVLRGLVSVLFGILALAMPGLTLAAIVILFGSFALIEGVINVVSAFRARHGQTRWWVLLIEGLISIAAGLLTFLWPGITALALVFVIGLWALFSGAVAIVTAIHLRKQIKGEWLLGLRGIASIVLGVLLLAHPGAGALAMVVWIALYALIFGFVLIIVGISVLLTKHEPPLTPAMPGHPPA